MTTTYVVMPDLEIEVDRASMTVGFDKNGALFEITFRQLFNITSIVLDEMAEKIDDEIVG
jgi:hypothetical protein